LWGYNNGTTKENIDTIQVSLSDEILKAIDEVQAII
jgi:hypothetical protein